MALPIKNKTQDQTEIHAAREVQKTTNKIGELRMYKGHTLYEFDVEKQELREAEFQKNDTVTLQLIAAGRVPRKRILIKKNHLYVGALNKKNAMRKLIKKYGANQ